MRWRVQDRSQQVSSTAAIEGYFAEVTLFGTLSEFRQRNGGRAVITSERLDEGVPVVDSLPVAVKRFFQNQAATVECNGESYLDSIHRTGRGRSSPVLVMLS